MIYNGPAQQTVDPMHLSIVRDPAPPSLHLDTKGPDTSTNTNPQKSSFSPESPYADTSSPGTSVRRPLFLDTPSPPFSSEASPQHQIFEIIPDQVMPHSSNLPSNDAMEVETPAERDEDITMGSPPIGPAGSPHASHAASQSPSAISLNLNPNSDPGLRQSPSRSGETTAELPGQPPQSRSSTQAVDLPVLEHDTEKPAQLMELDKDPPEKKDGANTGDVQPPSEQHAVARPANAVSTSERRIAQDPAPKSSNASGRAGSTATSRPLPNTVSTSQESRGKPRQNPKQKERSASGPRPAPTESVPKNHRARRRRIRREKRRQQKSEDPDLSAMTDRESEPGPVPPVGSNTPLVGASEPGSASVANDEATKEDEDGKRDGVIEQHFKCIAKMMPPELVRPTLPNHCMGSFPFC
jgi:hypothetical protein